MKRLKSKVKYYEECLEMPAAGWAFNCHLVATRAIENGCINARAQYGFYTGPVSEECEIAIWKRQYAQRIPIRHGWAISEDGTITDFTRWVFEGKPPYIAIIREHDPEYNDYDQGMAKFKERFAKPCPSRDDPRPNFSRLAASFQPGELESWIMKLTGDSQGYPFTMGQVLWLANLGPQHLEDKGRSLYAALDAAKLRSFIPIDFWDEVMQRRNPIYRKNTDESIRRLERLAKQGDPEAQSSLDAARRRIPCQHLDTRWDRHLICICDRTQSCSICTDYYEMINNDYLIEHVKECLACRDQLDRYDHSSEASAVEACITCQEFKRNPDAQDRELERKAAQGDLEAALRVYYARIRNGLLPTLPKLGTKDRFTVENPPSSDADRLATTRYGIYHLHERLAEQKTRVSQNEDLMARLIVDELQNQKYDTWERPFWATRDPQMERRNPDSDIRALERLARREPTVENLIHLYHAQYRSGIPGIGLEKIQQWWGDAERTLGDPPWAGLGGLSAAHYPIHPNDIFGDSENLNRWHGYWRGYPVRISILQTPRREPKYMEHRLSIIMGTGRGYGEFPNGYKFKAFLLDSDTIAILPPEYEGTAHDGPAIGLEPWPNELLQPNNFGSLGDLLDHLGERLFLYERGRDLVSVAKPTCNNCGQPRVILEQFGHQYYRCNRCE